MRKRLGRTLAKSHPYGSLISWHYCYQSSIGKIYEKEVPWEMRKIIGAGLDAYLMYPVYYHMRDRLHLQLSSGANNE